MARHDPEKTLLLKSLMLRTGDLNLSCQRTNAAMNTSPTARLHTAQTSGMFTMPSMLSMIPMP